MNKREMRRKLASLSFAEKIEILERLRDRSVAIAASGLRRKKNAASQNRKADTQTRPQRLPGLARRRFDPSRAEWWIRLPHAPANDEEKSKSAKW